MSDEILQSPLRRVFVYGATAAFIAAVILIAASALGSRPTPKVAFAVTLKVDQRELKASGTTYLTDGRFSFDGGRLSFAGRIEGDRVGIEGKVAAADSAPGRGFRASGRIVGDHVSATVNGTDGRRLGTLRLDLPGE